MGRGLTMHASRRGFRFEERLEEPALMLLAQRRGKEVRRASPSAAAAAAKVMRPLFREVGLSLREIDSRWAELAGAQLAAATRPEKLSGSGAARTLTIKVHPAAAVLLQHQQPLLLERLRLAGAEVQRLALVQGWPAPRAQQAQPRPNPAAAGEPDGAEGLLEALQGIEHGPLRAALARLGRAVDCPPPRR